MPLTMPTVRTATICLLMFWLASDCLSADEPKKEPTKTESHPQAQSSFTPTPHRQQYEPLHQSDWWRYYEGPNAFFYAAPNEFYYQPPKQFFYEAPSEFFYW
ncbi:MAG: hypothetical protein ACFCD0_07020 [Gemmataceae bacterium]